MTGSLYEKHILKEKEFCLAYSSQHSQGRNVTAEIHDRKVLEKVLVEAGCSALSSDNTDNVESLMG